MNKQLIEQSLSSLGFSQLTPMQENTINHAFDRRDLILLSPTGSGKTLAYLLPLLLNLDKIKADSIKAMVIVPSRELAIQVYRVFTSLKSKFIATCCYGGHSLADEKRSLLAENTSIVIGTPGRLLDHIGQGNLNTEGIELLVIDEFDKALEFGFHDEMTQIIAQLPNLQQRFLVSATDSEELPNFTGVDKRVLKLNYLEENAQLDERLKLKVVTSPEKDKLETLYKLICTFNGESTIVFCNHRDAVDRINNALKEHNIYSEAFHGGLEQDNRERALYKFSNGSTQVLVSTDLAARGLDIPEVAHIIHYHLPVNEDAFTHRNGRTARWDADGSAYIILHQEESLPEYVTNECEEFKFPSSTPKPIEPLWVTIYVGKGKKDKLNKIDIVGFCYKKGKLHKDDLGRIDVKDHFSYIAVRRTAVKQLLKLIQGEKIKGMKTIFQEAY